MENKNVYGTSSQELRMASDRIFGIELVMNLHDCDPKIIRSKDKIKEYAQQLCKQIEMVPYGEPWAERFGLGDNITAGYSLVQLIETSSITGHFSELWDTAYINVFSCKEFDVEEALNFSKDFFGAKEYDNKVLIR